MQLCNEKKNIFDVILFLLGHGIGQVGSAYMSGLLTAEKAIQVAYHVGQAIDKSGHLADTSGK